MIHCIILASAIYCNVPLPRERPIVHQPKPAATVVVVQSFKEFP